MCSKALLNLTFTSTSSALRLCASYIKQTHVGHVFLGLTDEREGCGSSIQAVAHECPQLDSSVPLAGRMCVGASHVQSKLHVLTIGLFLFVHECPFRIFTLQHLLYLHKHVHALD